MSASPNDPRPPSTAAPRLAAVAPLLAVGAVVLVCPTRASAQAIDGTWVEVLVSERVDVRNWGPNCGPRPTAHGTRQSSRSVQITAAGGVINIPSAGLRSDTCKYVSVARKTAYSSSSFKLHCATPVDTSPRESAVSTFTLSPDGNELRYKARVSVYWKLQGDICEAEATYERLYRRPEPASEPVAESPPPAGDPAPADTPSPRPTAARPTAPPEDDDPEGIVLIPVVSEPTVGPSGGRATPVVVTRPRTNAAASPPLALWFGVGIGALLAGAVGAFALAWWSRRRQRPTTSDVAATAPAPVAPRPPRRRADPNAAHARTVLLQAVQGPATADPPHEQEDDASIDRLDTTVGAMACPACQRRYELGATFCPYDGQRLRPDDIAHAHDLQLTVCPQCHRRFPHDALFCPEDGASLTPLEEHDAHPVASPLTICPTCQRELGGGLTHCPEDGSPLLPLIGRRTLGLPVVGAGPLSQICPECGTRYPADVGFCGKDGVSLVHVN